MSEFTRESLAATKNLYHKNIPAHLRILGCASLVRNSVLEGRSKDWLAFELPRLGLIKTLCWQVHSVRNGQILSGSPKAEERINLEHYPEQEKDHSRWASSSVRSWTSSPKVKPGAAWATRRKAARQRRLLRSCMLWVSLFLSVQTKFDRLYRPRLFSKHWAPQSIKCKVSN